MGRYEYILHLRDKMSGTLQKTGVTGRKVYDDLATRQEKLTRLSSGFAGVVGKLGLAFGAFQLGKKIITAGVEIEQTRVAFGTFMGDVQKGNALIAELNQFANVTPYTNDEVIKAGRQFLAAQIPANKITDTLRNVGDVAAGAKIPLNDLAQIYSKAMNKGKVQAEELNQLAERGVPILATFSKMYGKTTAEVMKMGEKGELTSDKLAEAFQVMTGEGGLFYNMMEKQSQTVGGKWSTLMGKVGMIFQKLGEKAAPVITFIVDKLLWAADKVIPMLQAIAQPFQWLFDQIRRGNVVIGIATALLVGWTAGILIYKGVIIAIALATKIWAMVQTGLNVALWANPIGLIVAAIVALIAVITYVIWKTDGWGKAWNHVTQGATLTFKAFTGGVKLMFNTMVDGIMMGINNIMLAYYKVKEAAGIGDSKTNQAQIKRLQDDNKRRAGEIVQGAKQVVTDAVMGAAHFAAAGKSLSWNKDKKFSDLTDGIKDKLGMGDATMAGSGDGTGLDPAGDGGTAKEITAGGSKPTTINITLGNLVETLTINASGVREGASDMERMVQEALLRVLNSANGIAYGN